MTDARDRASKLFDDCRGASKALALPFIIEAIIEAERAAETKGYERGMIYLARRIGEVKTETWNAAKAKAEFVTHKWADEVFNGQGEISLVKWIRQHADLIASLEPDEGEAK